MKSTSITLGIFLSLLCFSFEVQAQVFVKADASGANDGTSWTDAYTSLQDGINASEGAAVWVAAGTYRPVGDTSATFLLIEDLELYGGFAGTETDLSERDIAANPTILSGDLNGDDTLGDFENNRNDNVQTVLTIDSVITSISLVDGFVITGGQADGTYVEQPAVSGGGIYCEGFPRIANCTFTDNYARGYGGGFYALCLDAGPDDHLQVDNCLFTGNRSNFLSGGLHYQMSGTGNSLEVTNTMFVDNFASVLGGGASIGPSAIAQDLEISFDQCHFEGNESQAAAGLGMIWHCKGGSISVTESTFSGNLATFAPQTFLSKGGGYSIYHSTGATECYSVVENCVFTDNVAASLGGGFGVTFQNERNVVDVVNCEFENNSSTELAVDWGGGAIAGEQYASDGVGELNIRGCTIQNNSTAGTGGGLDLYAEGAFLVKVEASEFVNNTTDNNGMSIHTTGFQNTMDGFLTVANSLFTGHGTIGNAVIHNKELFNTKIVSCTFTDNETVAILQESVGALEIQNSILHNPDGINLEVISEATSLGGNLVTDESMEDILTADDLQVEDPFFTGIGHYPYQLSEQSPAINAGILLDDVPEFDLAGNPRIQSTAIDIGAYESPFDMTVNTTELVDSRSLSIAPNPAGATTSLLIDNDWTGQLEVRLTNVAGQVVHVQTYEKVLGLATCLLDLAHLEAGIYTLSVSNTEAIMVKKLVKI